MDTSKVVIPCFALPIHQGVYNNKKGIYIIYAKQYPKHSGTELLVPYWQLFLCQNQRDYAMETI
jgi:hypothetical protein